MCHVCYARKRLRTLQRVLNIRIFVTFIDLWSFFSLFTEIIEVKLHYQKYHIILENRMCHVCTVWAGVSKQTNSCVFVFLTEV